MTLHARKKRSKTRHTFNFSLSEKQREALKVLAATEGVSAADWVRARLLSAEPPPEREKDSDMRVFQLRADDELRAAAAPLGNLSNWLRDEIEAAQKKRG